MQVRASAYISIPDSFSNHRNTPAVQPNIAGVSYSDVTETAPFAASYFSHSDPVEAKREEAVPRYLSAILLASLSRDSFFGAVYAKYTFEGHIAG